MLDWPNRLPGLQRESSHRSDPQMNKRNPTYERDIFETQLGHSEMERSGCLSSIGSNRVCPGRHALSEKVPIECIRDIGTILVGNGPENI
jgi:hypothetical protein